EQRDMARKLVEIADLRHVDAKRASRPNTGALFVPADGGSDDSGGSDVHLDTISAQAQADLRHRLLGAERGGAGFEHRLANLEHNLDQVAELLTRESLDRLCRVDRRVGGSGRGGHSSLPGRWIASRTRSRLSRPDQSYTFRS